MPVQVHDDTALITGEQLSEYLLCQNAEGRFSTWEKTVARIALQSDETFPAKDAVVQLPDTEAEGESVADGSALPLDIIPFALSVIWRASVSTLFPKVSLGNRYNEEFRRFLVGDTAVPSNVRLFVSIVNVNATPRIDRVVIPPDTLRVNGFHTHQFGHFGFYFHVIVGGQPPILDRFCFIRTQRVILSDGTRMLKSAARTLIKATPKGKLGRRPKP
jgi:hypothetical protein